MAQYLGELADYHFTLVHKPGNLNHADAFSRWPDHDNGASDNEDVVVLGPEPFANAAEVLDLEQEVFIAQKEHRNEMEKLQEDFPLNELNKKWFHHGRPVVPEMEELRRRLLSQYHNHPLAEHLGITNTTANLLKDFWGPTLKCFVTEYMGGCATCQSTKPNTTRPTPPLMPIITTGVQPPFETISLDLIMDLPTSQGYDSILTVIDHGCSKAAIFLPCHKTIDATGVAALYLVRIFPFYRILKRIISDRDPRFTAQFIQQLCTILGINQNLSTAYHPQTDGQLEQANQRVEQYLRIYGNEEKNDWASLLPLAQFIHNSWRNKSIGATPFDLLIGHTPTIQVWSNEVSIPELTQCKEWLE